jgi:hypothetical protein
MFEVHPFVRIAFDEGFFKHHESPNIINALEQAVMEGDNPVHDVVYLVEYQEGILSN